MRESNLFVKQRRVAESDHQRVKTPLEPAIEGVQVTPARPQRGNPAPTSQLLLEDLAAHLFQLPAGLFLVLTFRKRADRRLPPEVCQTRAATRRICPVRPIQEWLSRPHYDRCSVDGDRPVGA
jgi:hypothetical protein